MAVARILAVCLGNICRSPMAEGVLKHKARFLGLDVHVDSAATSHWHIGEQPDKRAIKEMMLHGIDISDQCARQFTVDDFDRFDHILAMDISNKENILKLARNDADRSKVELILDYGTNGHDLSVPDPYYDNNFGQVYELLNRSSDEFLRKFDPRSNNTASRP